MAKKIIFDITLEEQLAEQFNLIRNTEQKTGSAYDFTNKDNNKIELKHDKRAAKTGNIFVEFRQSFDTGNTWRDSGITLACEQADFIWLILEEKPKTIYQIEPKILLDLAKTFPYKNSGIGVNGNGRNIIASGYLLKVTEFMKLNPIIIEI
jgi:hypothetical protein